LDVGDKPQHYNRKILDFCLAFRYKIEKMKDKKRILKSLFIISILFITSCVHKELRNRIFLPPTIETRVGKDTGFFNIGLHLANNYCVIDDVKNVSINLYGLNGTFVNIKPSLPFSLFLSQGEENYLAELHLYCPSKPLSPGIGINRFYATHFKSTNFFLLLNFTSDDFNIYGSLGYFRTPIKNELIFEDSVSYYETYTSNERVFCSTVGINTRPIKNLGFFSTFTYFNIPKGIKTYKVVDDKPYVVDIKYENAKMILGTYLEF